MDLSWGHGAPAVQLGTEGCVSVLPMLPRSYQPGFLFQGSSQQPMWKGGSHGCFLSLVQVKAQDSDNQLRLQASTQFFIHISTDIAVCITACSLAERSYVPGIVTDHLVYRISVTADCGCDHRVGDQPGLSVSSLSQPLHLPSVFKATDRLSAGAC